MWYVIREDIQPVLATFEAHGKRYEIRQLVTGPLVSFDVASGKLTPWPAGFTIETIRHEIESGADFEKANQQAARPNNQRGKGGA